MSHDWRPVGMTDPPDHYECATPGCDATTAEAMVYVPVDQLAGAVKALEKALAILDDPAHDDEDARHMARWVVFNATTTPGGQ